MNKTPPRWKDRDAEKPRRLVTGRRWPFRVPWLWLLVLGLAGAMGYVYFAAPNKAQREAATASRGGARQGANAPRATSVVAAPVTAGDIDVYLQGLGTAIPLNTVTVRSRVDGQVMRVLFREGSIVQRGDLLAQIDPRPFQVQLEQAEGQLARDLALLTNARLDLERYQVLYQQDSIAKQQLDTQAALVRQYEGEARADRGQIDNAKLQLTYSRIVAPITGRAGLRQVDEGNIVHATDANGLVVITQLQPISVVFTLPEDSIPKVMPKLQAGERLEVVAFDRAQRNKLADGVLVTLDNQIDPATGTVKLKAQFTNEAYSLFPNQFVNARLLVEVRRGVTIVPSPAVQLGSQGTFVYVVLHDQRVALRPVRTGATQGEHTEVVSGLAPGELVVVEGVDKLRDGATAQVTMKDGRAGKPSGPGAPRQPDPDNTNQQGNAAPRPGA